MIRLAIRGMGARKLRSFLTAVAVLLGVAMVAGTYVQTDRISSAMEDITQTARAGTDAVVTRPEPFTSDFAPDNGLPEAVLAEVRAVPGVANAQGHVADVGSLVVNGETAGSGYAPTMVMSAAGEPFSPLEFTDGRLPQRPGEVAVDAKTAGDESLQVGQRVGLTTRTGLKQVTISGIAEYGDAQSLGGATLVVGTLDDIQRWYARRGEFSEIVVAADEGIADTEIARRLTAALPSSVRVETGRANAQEDADEINEAIGSFLTPALLALSGAALLVGGFIIFNTFSITVAQRTREFGMLRALGATRRQVLGSVTVEALLIGVVASVLGILGGLGFATLLGSLFNAIGFTIPTTAPELAPRTIALSLVIGIGVTLVAAIVPARRATRVPPIAALNQAVAADEPARRRRLAPFVAGAVSLLGLVLLVQGLFGGGPANARLGGLAGGAVLIFVGIALVSRHLVRPLASAIGWPLEHAFHEPGRLARDNAMRNPGRTATTSAALTVGLALVVFVAVFAAGLKGSISGLIDDVVKADLIVTEQNFQPLAAGAGQAIAGVDGVRGVSPQYMDQVEVNGEPVSSLVDQMDGVDPVSMPAVYEPQWRKGGTDALFGRLYGDNALVEQQFAKEHGIAVGETFRIQTTAGKSATLKAIGEYEDPMILQGLMVNAATFRRLSAVRDPMAFFVGTDPGVAADEIKPRIDAALSRYPTAETRTNSDYKSVIEGQVNSIVYLLYALLAMSLVISLFGIANSLFLSIHERVREFGLLRAIGATQSQVRRVVRYESVITSIIGGALGIVVGVVFGALGIAALADLGLTFTLPLAQLGVFAVLAVLVGMAGAMIPARRAARVDVLDAMRHD